jgi:isocitrate dehydrogenase
MLVHINQPDIAEITHNAWLRTIEDGVHTYDMFKEGTSKQRVGTKEFSEAVVARLGQKPETLKPVTYSANVVDTNPKPIYSTPTPQRKDLVGVDVFLDWWKGAFYGVANQLGELVETVNGEGLKLQSIANRGVKVYPGGQPDTFTVDHWRCRFVAETEGNRVSHWQLIKLLERMDAAGLDVIKTENLYYFDGVKGYSA